MEHVERPSQGLRAWLAAAGVFVVLLLVLLALEPSAPYLITALALILAAAVGVTTWALLRTRAARRSYEGCLTEWAAEKAVQAERLRIARDLYDLASHGLGLMTVRVGHGATRARRPSHQPRRPRSRDRTARPTHRRNHGSLADAP